MKKLVKLDKNLRLTEIDWKATRRQAEMVRDYIADAPEAEQQKYQYDKKVMPLVNAFLEGSLEIPWLPNRETTKFYDPYPARFIMEGQAPDLVRSFKDVYYKFENMISADPSIFSLSTHESGEYIFGKYDVEKEGDLYEWCWFED